MLRASPYDREIAALAIPALATLVAEPLYVLATDPARNALIVGTADELGRKSLTAGRVNWIAGGPPADHFTAEIKIRYKARFVPGTVTVLPDGGVQVDFAEPQRDITPGQGVVFYAGEECLGGGIISRGQ